MNFVGVYTRVLALLAPDRWIAVGLALSALALAGLQFLEPILFGRVVDVLSASGRLPADEIWRQAIALLIVWGAVGLTSIAANVATSLLSDRMAHRNRLSAMHQFFQHVLALPVSFHGDTQSGRIIKIMLVGTDHLFSVWLSFFREHLTTFLSAIVLLPLTVFLNWRLSLLLMLLVVVFIVVATIVIQKTQDAQEHVEGLQSELAGNVQDALSNVVVVQAFTRMNAESRMFGDIIRQVLDHQFPVLNWWAVVSVLTRGSSTVCVISVFILGTLLNMRGQATVGEIVSFMGFAGMLIARMEGAVAFASRLVFQMPALIEMFQVLDARSTVPEKANALDIGRVHGNVCFSDVTFGYPGGPNILHNVSFKASKGQVIALVGQTGAGKSTAMSLLQRLWDPTGGRISVDGHNLKNLTLNNLRNNIGVVFQDSMLFNRTILENLLVGRPDASMTEIEQACRMAEAHDFITRQPNGYDTLIGERGSTLSGGQKQRLSIARALLKNSPILILDEATSALDTATEARVQKALQALMAGRTTFIIAHRLSTVRDADKILVFEGGGIVESGTFNALVALGGKFSELVQTQLSTAASSS